MEFKTKLLIDFDNKMSCIHELSLKCYTVVMMTSLLNIILTTKFNSLTTIHHICDIAKIKLTCT